MKKLTFKLIACLAMLLCVASMTSCGKKDKKALLETVPADTAGLLIIDANQVWKQLDIKVDGDDVTYCKELKEIVSLAGLERKDKKVFDAVMKVIDDSSRSFVLFEYDAQPWFTFFVGDDEKFIKLLEDEGELEFDKDGDYMVAGDNVAVKDNQVWVSEKIDTEVIEKFLGLDKDKRFVKKYETVADELLADNVTCGFFANIETAKGLLGSDDSQMLSLAMSVAFDGAQYLVGKTVLSDKDITGEVRILNDKFAPAKFNFPMGKIDATAMSRLNNEAPFIAALAIDPAMTKKIESLLDKYAGLSEADRVQFVTFEKIKGTIGASFSASDDGTAFMTFDNANTPVEMGKLFAEAINYGGLPIECTTAGNTLVMRLEGTPQAGKGQAPSQLIGQYAGYYIDFSKISDRIVSGYSFKNWGKMWYTLGPDGAGIKQTSVWEIKDPIRTLLSECLALFKAASSGNVTFPVGEELERKMSFPAPVEPLYPDSYMDTTAVIEDYSYAPEPDLYY